MRSSLGLCLALVCVVAATLSAPAFARPAKAQPKLAAGMRAVRIARTFLGVRYRFGGTDPRGFDCSGLIYFVYRRVGVRLPRTTYDQFGVGRKVTRWALKPGDLLFFYGRGHVGIYAGKGRFIHSNRTGGSVRIGRLKDGYGAALVGARRVAPGS